MEVFLHYGRSFALSSPEFESLLFEIGLVLSVQRFKIIYQLKYLLDIYSKWYSGMYSCLVDIEHFILICIGRAGLRFTLS